MNRKSVLSALQRRFGVTRNEALFVLILLVLPFGGLLLESLGGTEAQRISAADVQAMLDSASAAERTSFVGLTPEGEPVAELARGDTIVQRDDGFPQPTVKKTPVQGRLDLNTASREALIALPGIGPATAEKILAYRKEQAFVRTEDLMRIKGIGKVKYGKLRPYITVGEAQN